MSASTVYEPPNAARVVAPTAIVTTAVTPRLASAVAIAIAERPGNRRADGYRNILEDPHVGLISLIPGRGDTLRINGRARLVSDAPFFDDMVVKGHRPLLAVVIEIDEIFHHCSKAFLRSQLWEPETWDPEGRVPRRAVIAQLCERPEDPIEELDAYYEVTNYSRGLYA